MNPFKKLAIHIKKNVAEYYTLLSIVLAVPVTVSLIAGYKWGLLLSFVSQALIGTLYIRGKE